MLNMKFSDICSW